MSDLAELLVMHAVVRIFVGAAFIVACFLLLVGRVVESLAADTLAARDLWRRRMSRRQFLSARRAPSPASAAFRPQQRKDLPRDVPLGTHVADRPGIAG